MKMTILFSIVFLSCSMQLYGAYYPKSSPLKNSSDRLNKKIPQNSFPLSIKTEKGIKVFDVIPDQNDRISLQQLIAQLTMVLQKDGMNVVSSQIRLIAGGQIFNDQSDFIASSMFKNNEVICFIKVIQRTIADYQVILRAINSLLTYVKQTNDANALNDVEKIQNLFIQNNYSKELLIGLDILMSKFITAHVNKTVVNASQQTILIMLCKDIQSKIQEELAFF